MSDPGTILDEIGILACGVESEIAGDVARVARAMRVAVWTPGPDPVVEVDFAEFDQALECDRDSLEAYSQRDGLVEIVDRVDRRLAGFCFSLVYHR